MEDKWKTNRFAKSYKAKLDHKEHMKDKGFATDREKTSLSRALKNKQK